MQDPNIQEVDPIIKQNYTLQSVQGKGAYGIVWKAVHNTTKQIVAIKKIFDAFQNSTDAQRTYREVIFLLQLNHPNIIRLNEIIKANNNKDLYLIFDFMESDVHKVIRANLLSPEHIKYIIYQLCLGVKYIHSTDLVHRDLKPSNLLIDSECQIKIADFGLSRSLQIFENSQQQQPIMTEYIATRWYRAPEILFATQNYSKKVDMWSIGCILAELLLKKPLFPGTSSLNQIERIIQLIGNPKYSDLVSVPKHLFQTVIQSLNTNKKKTFKQQFPNEDAKSIDFIRKCLIYNPDARMSIEQALEHEYLSDFVGAGTDIVSDFKIFVPLDENKQIDTNNYRENLYEIIQMKQKGIDPLEYIKKQRENFIKKQQFQEKLKHQSNGCNATSYLNNFSKQVQDFNKRRTSNNNNDKTNFIEKKEDNKLESQESTSVSTEQTKKLRTHQKAQSTVIQQQELNQIKNCIVNNSKTNINNSQQSIIKQENGKPPDHENIKALPSNIQKQRLLKFFDSKITVAKNALMASKASNPNLSQTIKQGVQQNSFVFFKPKNLQKDQKNSSTINLCHQSRAHESVDHKKSVSKKYFNFEN